MTETRNLWARPAHAFIRDQVTARPGAAIEKALSAIVEREGFRLKFKDNPNGGRTWTIHPPQP